MCKNCAFGKTKSVHIRETPLIQRVSTVLYLSLSLLEYPSKGLPISLTKTAKSFILLPLYQCTCQQCFALNPAKVSQTYPTHLSSLQVNIILIIIIIIIIIIIV